MIICHLNILYRILSSARNNPGVLQARMLLAVAPAVIVAPVIIIAPVVRIAIKLEISTVAVISLYISRELAVAQSIIVNHNIATLIKKSDIDVSVAYCPGNTVCYIIQ